LWGETRTFAFYRWRFMTYRVESGTIVSIPHNIIVIIAVNPERDRLSFVLSRVFTK
jgi:hypothetical protein